MNTLPTSRYLIQQQEYTILTFLTRLVACTQPAITCSKLTVETLEQGVKYVQS